MANQEHLAKLKEGVAAWNEWREENPDTDPDLSDTNLSGADLGDATLFRADLRDAELSNTNLFGADLIAVNLSNADLRSVELSRASLQRAVLVDTNLENAVLSGCLVYGVSAWEIKLTGAIQSNLVITPEDQRQIQVDNLQVAQFIYLLLSGSFEVEQHRNSATAPATGPRTKPSPRWHNSHSSDHDDYDHDYYPATIPWMTRTDEVLLTVCSGDHADSPLGTTPFPSE
jgi:hypothetical protein